MADFVADENYLNLVQQCETALTEIKENYSNALTKEDCFYWLSGYKTLSGKGQR